MEPAFKTSIHMFIDHALELLYLIFGTRYQMLVI